MAQLHNEEATLTRAAPSAVQSHSSRSYQPVEIVQCCVLHPERHERYSDKTGGKLIQSKIHEIITCCEGYDIALRRVPSGQLHSEEVLLNNLVLTLKQLFHVPVTSNKSPLKKVDTGSSRKPNTKGSWQFYTS